MRVRRWNIVVGMLLLSLSLVLYDVHLIPHWLKISGLILADVLMIYELFFKKCMCRIKDN